MFFSSPVSNITPPTVSVAMSRSDSRDSTCSSYQFTSQPMTVSYSTSPLYSQPMVRTISNCPSISSSMQRRDSSSSQQWISSPYRSCMRYTSSQDEPTSYLSDDDLLYLDCSGSKSHQLPIESIPNPVILRKKEMTTEEQIAMHRELAEKEQQFEQRRSSHHKTVRFVATTADQRKARRPSGPTLRRSAPVRKDLRHLNGPM